MGKKKILNTIILIIALCVFAYSGYQLYLILGDYKAIDEEYDTIRDAVVVQDSVDVQEEVEDEEIKEIFQVDFDALRAINNDVIGWIRFDEPSEINYPIAQGRDNNQYLYSSLEGKYLSAGTIFVDYQNDDDFRDENTVIYGHNMKNGSMFGRLRKFRNSEFCKENPYFYIYTPDGRTITYQVFAVKVVEDTSATYDKIYADAEEFQSYVDNIYKGALYTSKDVSVSAADRIVTLSTCTGEDNDRLVVFGVVVNEVMIGE